MATVEEQLAAIRAALDEHSQLIARLGSYDLEHHQKINAAIKSIGQLTRSVAATMDLLEQLIAFAPTVPPPPKEPAP